ncbi:cell division protein FtsZ [Bacillus toyonensis]|uniref:cell division protein FtsZ n=1 Tax=Bacillus toyonensis TaxID=155322 RepID=UPI002404ECC2|nr:cell division protein FtsZ [Bacillus toyonensis]MDF9451366.1 cell division protein FtsZ [Bacillus toyonensis]MDG1564255.1 cell division protein FtsZ [Bacillus toyonensis]
MAKNFLKNEVAVKMTMVGFGQAGTRMVDKFAEYKHTDGTAVYNCLALNSNDGDLAELKNVPKSNQVSLKLGGLGKNPERAVKVLESNEEAKDKLKEFITERVRPTDELVLFFAGLGGGTGTSTIIQAIEEFSAFHNKPVIAEELKSMAMKIPREELIKNQQKYARIAFNNAIERKDFIKMGIVVTLPVRADGPDVLRQVNKFSQEIWKLANDPAKGVAFVVFADNQHFYDEFKGLNENEKKGIGNSRDYANQRIGDIIHELNTAANGSGTSVILDSQDFKRILLERTGCLVINKVSRNMNQIENSEEIVDMFSESLKGSSFHHPIDLMKTNENGDLEASKVHHFGMLAILDEQKNIDDSFMDDAKVEVTNKLPINGTVFNGYLVSKNDFMGSVYTFYKTDALPSRLSKGLVEEYNEFKEKQSQIQYTKSQINTIEAQDFDDDFNIDFGDYFELEPVKDEEPQAKNDEELAAFMDPDKMFGTK